MRMTLAVVAALAACSGDKRPADPTPAPAPAKDAAPAQLAGIEVPVVSAQGLVPLADAPALTIAATRAAIIVDGAEVVTLKDAAVDPSELEGGAHGLTIPRLAALLGG